MVRLLHYDVDASLSIHSHSLTSLPCEISGNILTDSGQWLGTFVDSPAGCYPIRTIDALSPSFMLHAFPATTLPIYHRLGQAPNMLDCIPGGLIFAKHSPILKSVSLPKLAINT